MTTAPRRSKDGTREAIESAAWDLILDVGFSNVTVADITDRVGVTERTFFRHFESKEAVLFGSWRDELEVLADQVAHAPSNQAPLDAVRAAIIGLMSRYERDHRENVVRARLIAQSDAVASYERRVMHRAWEDTLAAALADRLGADATADLRPQLFAGMAVAALHAAVLTWSARGASGSLTSTVAEALDLLDSPENRPA